ncbi:acetyl-CoA synthetase-like protein [Linderina pennispora]|uniref:Acetyl-CoA synthetase-like protein n=1 Tax=Linderina pennispora TaxID=61395 RepID=A0A1Y1WDX1_9FUNG|nr:acetyl-CoA synthetase-like protein [Linderina pennispora]ORX71374.1 acetyl-CoA synthetase-like protein [Linderina pennispora]
MPVSSTYQRLDVPNVDLPSYFFGTVKKQTVYGQKPHLPFLISESKTLSFADLEKLTHGIASGLFNSAGLKKGDTLLVVLPNNIYYPAVTLATQMVGAVVSTANPLYTARELAHQIELTGAKMVVSIDAKVPVVKEAVRLANSPIPDSLIFTLDGTNRIFDIISPKPFPRVYLRTEEETASALSFIVFSSGTSGKPKGVMLSHRNIVSNIVQNMSFEDADEYLTARFSGIEETPHMIAVLPFFHIYGLTCILHLQLCQGRPLVIMPQFDLEKFCQLVQQYRCRAAHLVPPIILGLTKSPIVKKYDLSSFIFVNSGAAPLTKELQQEAQKVLGFPICQGYGLSESSPAITRVPPSNVVYGSSGRLVPNMEAKVIDDDGKEVGPGEVGELCYRGPNIMLGYLKNPAATAETLDSEGYLHTGDVGYIDKDGYNFITDRKKELIKYKGFQIPPAELEGLLVDHPAILDSAVIGIYDDVQATEVPKGFVVIKPDASKSGVVDEIHSWLNSRVTHYKRLRGGIEVIDAIPKSATGKILRRILKERESQKRKAKL